MRWQSTDDSSRWRWTVGAFWQQAKEASIENLEDKQIYEFFDYLYGINPQDWFGYYDDAGQLHQRFLPLSRPPGHGR